MTAVQALPNAWGAPSAPAALEPEKADWRWVYSSALVIGLIGLGVPFALSTRGYWPAASFAARASFLYVALGSLLIGIIGWSPRFFPVAAGLFLGFLGISQSTNDTFFLHGDERGAITLEEILALPLILTGLFGPRGESGPRRPTPSSFRAGWVLVAACGTISTILAVDPGIAVLTLLSRFYVPVLVAVAVYRRLRSIRDFEVLMFGFAAGVLLVTLFGFQRSVEGTSITDPYGFGSTQRYAGFSVSTAVPALYVMGLALWYGRARAEESAIVRAVVWLVIAGTIPMLFWLGAHRAPLVFAALLLMAWVPGAFRPVLSRPLMLLPLVLGAIAALLVVRYSVQTTTLDLRLMWDRLKELPTEGLWRHNRAEIYRIGLTTWLTSPIWGVGLNNLVAVTTGYLNLHSSLVGILFDVGLLGLAAFAMLLIPPLGVARPRFLTALSRSDRTFFYANVVSWALVEGMLIVDLPITSGQPKNNILIYLTLLYPILAMVVYTRHAPRPSPAEQVPAPFDSPWDLTVARPVSAGS
ncbi:MAG: hypothetical protein AB1716_03075 [Planctomycetota bacterium]